MKTNISEVFVLENAPVGTKYLIAIKAINIAQCISV